MLTTKGGGAQDWRTPQWLFDFLNVEFGPFQCDAAASDNNNLCNFYYTEEQNGLTRTWPDRTFCNPPWKTPKPWVDWALHNAVDRRRSILLLPSIGMYAQWYRNYKAYFHTHILDHRVAFVAPSPRAKKSPNGGVMVLSFGYAYAGMISMLEIGHVRPSKSRKSLLVVPA